MSTTTIRISDETKARMHAAAKAMGTSAHALIVEAIEEKADRLDKQAAFVGEARARAANVAQTGQTLAWDDVKAYLQASLAPDNAPVKPSPRRIDQGQRGQ